MRQLTPQDILHLLGRRLTDPARGFIQALARTIGLTCLGVGFAICWMPIAVWKYVFGKFAHEGVKEDVRNLLAAEVVLSSLATVTFFAGGLWLILCGAFCVLFALVTLGRALMDT